VLHAAGQSEEAAAALAQALERYQQKNNLAMSAQVRERLAELQDAAPRRTFPSHPCARASSPS
jgi:hypothetical protein